MEKLHSEAALDGAIEKTRIATFCNNGQSVPSAIHHWSTVLDLPIILKRNPPCCFSLSVSIRKAVYSCANCSIRHLWCHLSWENCKQNLQCPFVGSAAYHHPGITDLQSWQKLMTHEELFMNTRLYAPFPLAMLIPELKKKNTLCHLPIHLQIA